MSSNRTSKSTQALMLSPLQTPPKNMPPPSDMGPKGVTRQNTTTSSSPDSAVDHLLSPCSQLIPWGTPPGSAQRNSTSDFTDIMNLLPKTQSAFTHGKPLEWFMKNDERTAIIPDGATLGVGHPRTAVAPGAYFMGPDTESTISYAHSYSNSVGTPCTTLEGETSPYLRRPRYPSYTTVSTDNFRVTKSSRQLQEATTTDYVKLRDVNGFSAGASETDDEEENQYSEKPLQIYVDEPYDRQPPPPMEVQPPVPMEVQPAPPAPASEYGYGSTARLEVAPTPALQRSRSNDSSLRAPSQRYTSSQCRDTHYQQTLPPLPHPRDSQPHNHSQRNRLPQNPRLINGQHRQQPYHHHHHHHHHHQPQSQSPQQHRVFRCDFDWAGCTNTFATKNEWKRHVSSQHMQDKIWRCDYPSCADRKAATFNRKDLFGQHIKRMHVPEGPAYNKVPPPNGGKPQHPKTPEMTAFLNTEIPRIQERCMIVLRQLPEDSVCGYCGRTFSGPSSWEERMEHVGRHYETATSNNDNIDPSRWALDQNLINWALQMGIIYNDQGRYRLKSVGKDAVVDSIPLRSSNRGLRNDVGNTGRSGHGPYHNGGAMARPGAHR